MIVLSYVMKRKIKKIFLEVIFNNKILYIKICSMKLPTTKNFFKLTGDWTTSNLILNLLNLTSLLGELLTDPELIYIIYNK